MHTITIHFSSSEDADWADKFLTQAMQRPRSLGALQLGILQDALSRAALVHRQHQPDFAAETPEAAV